MYSAFEWRVESPGHDELRCVLFRKCMEARLLVPIVSVLPLAEHFPKMFYVPSGNLVDSRQYIRNEAFWCETE